MAKPVEIDFYGKNLTAQNLNDVWQKFNQQVLASSDAPIILDLGNNQLGLQGVIALEAIVKHPRLTELRLDSNQLDGEACVKLCQILELRQSPLQALSLSGNKITLLGAQALAQLLIETLGLTYLDLSECDISSEGIEHIAHAVGVHVSLEKLILSKNRVRKATQDIALMLQQNTFMKSLNLCDCELAPEESKELVHAVAIHPALREFNIDGNDLPAGMATLFLDDLIYNNVLIEYAGPDVNGQIQSICQRNKTIPCTTPWSAEYNPFADVEQRMASLVVNTAPTHHASLTFLTGQHAIRGKKLTCERFGTTLSKSILEQTYTEACRKHSKPT